MPYSRSVKAAQNERVMHLRLEQAVFRNDGGRYPAELRSLIQKNVRLKELLAGSDLEIEIMKEIAVKSGKHTGMLDCGPTHRAGSHLTTCLWADGRSYGQVRYVPVFGKQNNHLLTGVTPSYMDLKKPGRLPAGIILVVKLSVVEVIHGRQAEFFMGNERHRFRLVCIALITESCAIFSPVHATMVILLF